MARKPTDIVPLMLRLRESDRRRIEQSAKRNKRSLNAEITARLEDSFLTFEREVEAWHKATVDMPIEAALARGLSVERMLELFPKWTLWDWASRTSRHQKHQAAIALLRILTPEIYAELGITDADIEIAAETGARKKQSTRED